VLAQPIACASSLHSAAVLQDLAGEGVQRRFGVSGVELGDNHHTLPPVFFIALPTVLCPPLCWVLPGHR
jgi:hypothetical protein